MEPETKQEKTGSVFGVYLPELTDEFVEKVTEECLSKQKLFVDRNRQIIPITKDLVRQGVCLNVWNIKTHYPTWKWVNGLSPESFKAVIVKLHTPFHLRWLNNLVYDQFLELCEPFRNERRIPGWLLYLARPYIGDTKPDAFGLLGGNIDLNEFDNGDKIRELFPNEKDYENSTEHPSDYAIIREFGEEGGGLQIIRLKKDSEGYTIKVKRPDGEEVPLVDEIYYERVAKFYEDSKPWEKNPKEEKRYADHEDFCFLINKVDGEMKNHVVKGETLAAEYVPLMALSPKDCFKKHAEMLRVTMNRVVHEYGRKNLANALDYITATFPESDKLRKEPKFRQPRLGMADNILWDNFTQDNKIKPFEK